MDPTIIFQIVALLLALSFHEMAHAWTANRLGDPTAARLGRMTMNPLAHIDPFGTILFPAMLMMSGAPVFGWAKPVPVNPLNLRRPGRDDMLVAAAGPLANVLLAVIAAIAFRMLGAAAAPPGSFMAAGALLLYYVVFINLILALFNMIPVPPLDGGGVLVNLLPPSMQPLADALRTYGFFILILLIFTGMIHYFLAPVGFLMALFLGGF